MEGRDEGGCGTKCLRFWDGWYMVIIGNERDVRDSKSWINWK